MEKLIELFKEYVENYGNDAKDPTIDYVVIYDGQGFYVGARFYSDEKVLSKKYGFIKWLVENDKIAYDIPNNSDLYRAFELACISLDNADYITMLLSISDTPIEDLISYLK